MLGWKIWASIVKKYFAGNALSSVRSVGFKAIFLVVSALSDHQEKRANCSFSI